MDPVLKTGGRKRPVGSNPTPSAMRSEKKRCQDGFSGGSAGPAERVATFCRTASHGAAKDDAKAVRSP